MIVTLTTDFGLADGYVAAMKGVILGINPAATLVDISHSVPHQDVRNAAFVLHTVHAFFPAGAIHLAVVDPGVGASRRALALKTPQAIFMAPDNGLLSYILADNAVEFLSSAPKLGLQDTPLPASVRAFHVNNPKYWRRPVSHTFHGRDVFAPVAAHLSLGVPLEEVGEAVHSLLAFRVPRPEPQADGALLAHVQHIDSFGNLISDVRGSDLPAETKIEIEIEIQGQKIRGLSSSYTEAQGLLAIMGSSGYLEIALKNGNAARALAASIGDTFVLRFR